MLVLLFENCFVFIIVRLSMIRQMTAVWLFIMNKLSQGTLFYLMNSWYFILWDGDVAVMTT